MFTSNEVIIKKIEGAKVASIDTVYVDKSRVDTVFETEIKYVDRVCKSSGIHDRERRENKQLFSQSSMTVPEISLKDITSSSPSMDKDETLILVNNSTPVFSEGIQPLE